MRRAAVFVLLSSCLRSLEPVPLPEDETAAPAPLEIFAVEPRSGFLPADGFTPTVVVVRGAGLEGGTVTFNGSAAAPSVSCPASTPSGSLCVSVPSNATSGPLTVAVGERSVTSIDAFTLIGAPTLVSIAPDSGYGGLVPVAGSVPPADGCTFLEPACARVLVLTGTSFDVANPENNRVTIGGLDAPLAGGIAPTLTTLTVIVPSGLAQGEHAVVVRTSAGEASGRSLRVPALPSVQSVSPLSMFFNQIVVLKGAGFDPITVGNNVVRLTIVADGVTYTEHAPLFSVTASTISFLAPTFGRAAIPAGVVASATLTVVTPQGQGELIGSINLIGPPRVSRLAVDNTRVNSLATLQPQTTHLSPLSPPYFRGAASPSSELVRVYAGEPCADPEPPLEKLASYLVVCGANFDSADNTRVRLYSAGQLVAVLNPIGIVKDDPSCPGEQAMRVLVPSPLVADELSVSTISVSDDRTAFTDVSFAPPPAVTRAYPPRALPDQIVRLYGSGFIDHPKAQRVTVRTPAKDVCATVLYVRDRQEMAVRLPAGVTGGTLIVTNGGGEVVVPQSVLSLTGARGHLSRDLFVPAAAVQIDSREESSDLPRELLNKQISLFDAAPMPDGNTFIASLHSGIFAEDTDSCESDSSEILPLIAIDRATNTGAPFTHALACGGNRQISVSTTGDVVASSYYRAQLVFPSFSQGHAVNFHHVPDGALLGSFDPPSAVPIAIEGAASYDGQHWAIVYATYPGGPVPRTLQVIDLAAPGTGPTTDLSSIASSFAPAGEPLQWRIEWRSASRFFLSAQASGSGCTGNSVEGYDFIGGTLTSVGSDAHNGLWATTTSNVDLFFRQLNLGLSEELYLRIFPLWLDFESIVLPRRYTEATRAKVSGSTLRVSFDDAPVNASPAWSTCADAGAKPFVRQNFWAPRFYDLPLTFGASSNATIDVGVRVETQAGVSFVRANSVRDTQPSCGATCNACLPCVPLCLERAKANAGCTTADLAATVDAFDPGCDLTIARDANPPDNQCSTGWVECLDRCVAQAAQPVRDAPRSRTFSVERFVDGGVERVKQRVEYHFTHASLPKSLTLPSSSAGAASEVFFTELAGGVSLANGVSGATGSAVAYAPNGVLYAGTTSGEILAKAPGAQTFSHFVTLANRCIVGLAAFPSGDALIALHTASCTSNALETYLATAIRLDQGLLEAQRVGDDLALGRRSVGTSHRVARVPQLDYVPVWDAFVTRLFDTGNGFPSASTLLRRGSGPGTLTSAPLSHFRFPAQIALVEDRPAMAMTYDTLDGPLRQWFRVAAPTPGVGELVAWNGPEHRVQDATLELEAARGPRVRVYSVLHGRAVLEAWRYSEIDPGASPLDPALSSYSPSRGLFFLRSTDFASERPVQRVHGWQRANVSDTVSTPPACAPLWSQQDVSGAVRPYLLGCLSVDDRGDRRISVDNQLLVSPSGTRAYLFARTTDDAVVTSSKPWCLHALSLQQGQLALVDLGVCTGSTNAAGVLNGVVDSSHDCSSVPGPCTPSPGAFALSPLGDELAYVGDDSKVYLVR